MADTTFLDDNDYMMDLIVRCNEMIDEVFDEPKMIDIPDVSVESTSISEDKSKRISHITFEGTKEEALKWTSCITDLRNFVKVIEDDFEYVRIQRLTTYKKTNSFIMSLIIHEKINNTSSN